MAVYLAALKPGDTILGHEPLPRRPPDPRPPAELLRQVLQGRPLRRAARTTSASTTTRCARSPREHRPKLIVVRRLAPTRAPSTSPRFARRADAAGALVMADIAHIAGLVAAGLHPEPGAALRLRDHDHPQDAARAARRPDPLPARRSAKDVNRALFPGIQGGPLMHVIAAKAVAFKEALAPGVQATTRSRSWPTRRRSPATLAGEGCRLVSGGTDNHLMLVDVFARGITGKDAEKALDAGRHHRQQEHDPLRHELADGRLRHPHRHARADHPRHEGAGDGGDRQADLPRPRRASRTRPSSPRCGATCGSSATASRSTPPARGLREGARQGLTCAPGHLR